jgi:DNA-directed RNA polymerase beta subunit
MRACWLARIGGTRSSQRTRASPMSERKYFGKIREGAEPPNLIEIQLDSYVEFLQQDVQLSKRKETGLQGSLPDRELRRKGHARLCEL